MDFFSELHGLLRSDNTGRGLACAVPAPDFDALADTLLTAKRVVILTGFPVDCGGTYHGETDGPGGAAVLARVLSFIGCTVSVLTDEVSFPQVLAAVNCMSPETKVICLPSERTRAFGETLMRQLSPTHFITIERPGKGRDGHFHSMRGSIIDEMVTDADFLLPLARDLGAVTIAIGDGGNELGMGAFRNMIIENVKHGAKIAAVEHADITLVSGVSNWWGWGISALLSAITGQWLLPTAAEEYRLLSAVIASGGVDGCTHLPTLSVDAQPLSDHLLLLDRFRTALVKYAVVRI